ncbi:unnamed protein product [Paramecium octaurelia]|uniref:Uncharacterized protein n=1 Tax=Paramecium octaurelia TaxID=43137 RepID=A0A8S1XRX1_PAROT|nr:unnamed protein product [Paramecium octaurelia]
MLSKRFGILKDKRDLELLQEAEASIMVCDVTQEDTFEEIDKYWLPEAKKYRKQNVYMLVIGRKKDLEEQKQQDCQSHNLQFAECNAKTADHVNNILIELSKMEQKKRGRKLMSIFIKISYFFLLFMIYK